MIKDKQSAGTGQGIRAARADQQSILQEEKTMKKWIALLLAVVMALALAGCGGAASSRSEERRVGKECGS